MPALSSARIVRHFSWLVLLPVFVARAGHAQETPPTEPASEGSTSELPADGSASDPPVERAVTRTRSLDDEIEPPGPRLTIGANAIRDRGATQLVEALQHRTGIRLDNQCSICNTTTIRLGGLPADYTLVTIDGIPVLGSLGVAYSLLAWDTATMDRIDVTRGPSPVRRGANAVAGTVDMRTRWSSHPFAEFTAQGGMFGHARTAGTVGLGNEDRSAILTGAWTTTDRIDRDGDGVSEQVAQDRLVLGTTLRWRLGDHHLQARGMVLQENRQGGVATDAWLAGVGDGELRRLTETILTRRVDAGVSHRVRLSPSVTLSNAGAFASHVQDSDYAGELYLARQHQAYLESVVSGTWRDTFDWQSGLTWRGEWLNENLAQQNRVYHQPGLFGLLAADWDWIRLQGGVRGEWHSVFGWVATPQASVAVRPHGTVELLLQAARGFRTPTPFFEQFKGVRPEGYTLAFDVTAPETSWTTSATLQWEPSSRFETAVHAAWTSIASPFRLDTELVADADGANEAIGRVVVTNSDEPLSVYSVEWTARVTPAWFLAIDVGWASFGYRDPGQALITANPTGQATGQLSLLLPWTDTRITVVGEVQAPIDLASVWGPDRFEVAGDDWRNWVGPSLEAGVAWDPNDPKLDRSPWFGLLNLRVQHPVQPWLDLFAGADNLLDVHQNDIDGPLFVSTADGTPRFDVIHIWGPQRGRFIYGGLTARW